MSGGSTWAESARLATELERVGFSGMLYTETSQVPWMQIAAAATAAPTLTFTTGIAVAFPRSPMVSAAIAWELAHNTEGRFRLGLGSQVKAHVQRRYGAEFAPPGPRLRDYVLAVKACFRAFRGDEKLDHDGPYYRLNLLPPQWAPPRHAFGDIKVDISAVGPYMTRMAGEVADGVHVHPLHSMQYIRQRLLPAVADGAALGGTRPDRRRPHRPGVRRARRHPRGTGAADRGGQDPDRVLRLDPELRVPVRRPRLRGDDRHSSASGCGPATSRGWRRSSPTRCSSTIAVVAPWDEIADRLVERYAGVASRVVSYLAAESIRRDPQLVDRWGEVARAVRAST